MSAPASGTRIGTAHSGQIMRRGNKCRIIVKPIVCGRCEIGNVYSGVKN